MSRLTVGSLFSGVGGFDLGLERAGHEIVWQVEWDKQARSVLRKHWPDADLYEDVRDVGISNLTPVDLICGGFPCQDLSVAGRRAGLDGDRSGLWFEFRRIVAELCPTWVLIENVPGLLSSNGGADLAVILRGLAELGYVGAWRTLDSQHFGVAQRRKRVFLLACRDSRAGCPAEVLALAEGMSGHPAPSREARERFTGEPVPSLAASGRGTARAGESRGQDPLVLAPALMASMWKGPGQNRDDLAVAHTLRAEGFDASEDGTGRGTPIIAFDTTQVTSKLNRSNPKPGDPCHPLAAGAHPPSVTHSVPRRLTPRECERLQGFPDDWTRWDHEGNELADGPRYRMMGNAVTVNVAEWIGRRLSSVGAA